MTAAAAFVGGCIPSSSSPWSLVEVHDEWQIAERRYLSEGSMAKLFETDNDGAETKEVGPNKELLAG